MTDQNSVEISVGLFAQPEFNRSDSFQDQRTQSFTSPTGISESGGSLGSHKVLSPIAVAQQNQHHNRKEPSEDLKNCRRSQALRTVRPDQFLMEKRTLQEIGTPSALAALARIEMSPEGRWTCVGASEAHQKGTRQRRSSIAPRQETQVADPSANLMSSDVDFPDTYLSMELSAVEESMEMLDMALQNEGNDLAPLPHNRPPEQPSVPASAVLGQGNTISLLSYLNAQDDVTKKESFLFTIEVEIAPGQKESIQMHEDDVCSAVALEFIRKHKLPQAKVWEPLTQFLQQSLDEQILLKSGEAETLKEQARIRAEEERKEREIATKTIGRRQTREEEKQMKAASTPKGNASGPRRASSTLRSREKKLNSSTMDRLKELARPKASREGLGAAFLAKSVAKDVNENPLGQNMNLAASNSDSIASSGPSAATGEVESEKELRPRVDLPRKFNASRSGPVPNKILTPRVAVDRTKGETGNPKQSVQNPSSARRTITPSRIEKLAAPRRDYSQEGTGTKERTSVEDDSPAPKPVTAQARVSSRGRLRSENRSSSRNSIPKASRGVSASRSGEQSGSRLHALNAERQKKMALLKEERERQEKREETEAMRNPLINSNSQKVESKVKRTLHADPSATAPQPSQMISSSSTERELGQHCTFKPRINGGKSEGQKGSGNAVVDRLMASQRAAEQKLSERRTFYENRDPKTGRELFKPIREN